MASFRKRGCKCKNKKKCTCGATWSFIVNLGIDPVTNKRKQKEVSGFKTKKEAEIAAAELEKQIRDKIYVDETNQTLKEFIDEWLEGYAKREMKESTYFNRKGIIDSRIIPELGHIKLKDFKVSTINSFYNKLNEDGLSKSYQRTIHNLLASFFKCAKEWDKIKINIMEKVKAPIPQRKEMTTWNKEHIDKFLEVTEDAPTRIAYVLALFCGLRKGEILGLRWDDIDFKNQTIHIVRTLVRVGEKLTFQEPKTKNSIRRIAIDDFVLNELKKRKKQQKVECELVVSTEIGTPYSPRNLSRNFDMFIERAGVPKIRFHDLRHTHATILLKLNENPKVVSERLGHSRTNITLDLYSHVTPDMQKQAAKKLSDYLLN